MEGDLRLHVELTHPTPHNPMWSSVCVLPESEGGVKSSSSTREGALSHCQSQVLKEISKLVISQRIKPFQSLTFEVVSPKSG